MPELDRSTMGILRALAGSFRSPDQVVDVPLVREEVVRLGPLAVARTTHAPGWRWSTHTRPVVGTALCQVRHVGVVLSGSLGIELADGRRMEFGPESVMDVPPGHDGWTIGEEPLVTIGWAGVHEWLVPAHGERVLASLLFTDIVDSTGHAERLGDRSWRSLLAAHDDAIRQLVSAAHGRVGSATGDGFLLLFDGPARAIATALQIRHEVHAIGLELRQGIHVGEIELAGDEIRGLAVHEAARVMAAAAPGQVVVSAVARALAAASGRRFTSLGEHQLKGLSGSHELFTIEAD